MHATMSPRLIMKSDDNVRYAYLRRDSKMWSHGVPWAWWDQVFLLRGRHEIYSQS